jgi:hypothetical protein
MEAIENVLTLAPVFDCARMFELSEVGRDLTLPASQYFLQLGYGQFLAAE